MAIQTHVLGLPRIGPRRELKFALEAYWKGNLHAQALETKAHELQNGNLARQEGLSLSTLGDFSWYDRVLDLSLVLGFIPERFQDISHWDPKDLLFAIARGAEAGDKKLEGSALRKWFDTNYHYVVPEFSASSRASLSEAAYKLVFGDLEAGHGRKVSLLGPASFLYLGSEEEGFSRLGLVPGLAKAYAKLLETLAKQGFEWIQIEEPILVLDELGSEWEAAVRQLWEPISKAKAGAKVLLATYFESLDEYLPLCADLTNSAADAVHLDLRSRPWEESLQLLDRQLEAIGVPISLGLIDGRSVWKEDLARILEDLVPVLQKHEGRDYFVSSSSSLLHLPYSLEFEKSQLQKNLLAGLAFAEEKIRELELLGRALEAKLGNLAFSPDLEKAFELHQQAYRTWRDWARTQAKPRKQDGSHSYRPLAKERVEAQRKELKLPLFPTTTIGSFPQTIELRRARKALREREIALEEYEEVIKEEIRRVIREQEELGLDVLVHGEPERSDMVEYFAESLDGFVTSENGWVQSYGSRCVRPPIIWNDVSRPQAMTLEWTKYAQSLTDKPVKGMLTGPLTIVKWSFPRKDLGFDEQVFQVADALAQEVLDLEEAGIRIIQIDEPAFKEGQPLKRKDADRYGEWASKAFRRTAALVKDSTQIHTHMCYSDFRDLLPWVAAMDADVITIETARTELALVDGFTSDLGFNDLGPGLFDVHSPVVPDKDLLKERIGRALEAIAAERLWINPDCGLKTRTWEQVIPSLSNLVQAAKEAREELRHKKGS